MKRIKIAQIGTSTFSHGNDIFNCLKRLDDIFEIVGFALPENEREKYPGRMADFDGYTEFTVDEILNNPEIEAVTVETEEKYLTKYAIMAAKKGKDIHMEKPGGTSLSEFEKLINTVKNSGKVFHTGYMYRYNHSVAELLSRIKKGELGEIISVEAQMNVAHPTELRSWLGGYKGGSMFFLGCHLIDLILQIRGMPEKVIPLNRSTGTDGLTAEDFGMAALVYQNGVSFAKVNSNEIGGFERRQLVVSGTKGTVELQPIEKFVDFSNGVSLVTTKTEYIKDIPDYGKSFDGEVHDRYDPMMRSFAQMVCGEKTNPYTPDYELQLYKTILECCGIKFILR